MAKLTASQRKLQEVTDILYPPGNPEHQWSADTFDDIAHALGSRRPPVRTPADKTVRELHGILYPPGDPEYQWSPDDLDRIAWALDDYLRNHGAEIGRSVRAENPRPGLVRGVITLGLTALGVTGIVMGRRAAGAK